MQRHAVKTTIWNDVQLKLNDRKPNKSALTKLNSDEWSEPTALQVKKLRGAGSRIFFDRQIPSRKHHGCSLSIFALEFSCNWDFWAPNFSLWTKIFWQPKIQWEWGHLPATPPTTTPLDMANPSTLWLVEAIVSSVTDSWTTVVDVYTTSKKTSSSCVQKQCQYTRPHNKINSSCSPTCCRFSRHTLMQYLMQYVMCTATIEGWQSPVSVNGNAVRRDRFQSLTVWKLSRLSSALVIRSS